jgi:dTDP-4-amino-4,6-dideoxygalactose transaminase
MKVPFLDLKIQYEAIRTEVTTAMQQVLDATAFAGGPFVAAFEKNYAAYCRVPHAIGVGNGTDALWLALLALDVGRGDEVITVPNSFIATAEAISLSGATPVFVDIDETTFTMDPARIEAAITPRTKAIIPVHLFGQMADMDPIMELARKHKLHVIEDAAQAQGAEYKGKPAGSIGDAGCFSFYPGKNLGAYGEAGAVVTSNPEVDRKIRCLRDHGQYKKYHHSMVGWNARMDGFQGAILDVKLRHLTAWNDARRKHAQSYRKLLADVKGLRLPVEPPRGKHIYHVFALRVPHRDAFLQSLADKGVACGIHYPVPIHLTEAYALLGKGPGSFPLTERIAQELLSLPMFPELTEEQVGYVAQCVKELCGCKCG